MTRLLEFSGRVCFSECLYFWTVGGDTSMPKKPAQELNRSPGAGFLQAEIRVCV